jgi:hypothetical protein
MSSRNGSFPVFSKAIGSKRDWNANSIFSETKRYI